MSKKIINRIKNKNKNFKTKTKETTIQNQKEKKIITLKSKFFLINIQNTKKKV